MTYPDFEANTPSEEAADLQNDARTCQPIGTMLTQARSPGVHGYTYFVRRADGLIKIGFSERPNRRVRGLAREHGELETLAIVPCSVAGEFETHQLFAVQRVEGEWFKSSPELLNFIEAVKNERVPPAPEPKRIKIHPAIAELKTIGRDLSSRLMKLPKQARPFASNIIAQVKWIETPEDVERMRPHIAYQARRLASVGAGLQ